MRQNNTIGPGTEEKLDNKVKGRLGGRIRIWLGVWFGLVFVFTILEIADVQDLLRQIFLMPVLAFVNLSPFVRESGISAMLDVDHGAKAGVQIRVAVFAVETFLIMLPICLYTKTRNRVFLYWSVAMAAPVIAALCWYFIMFLRLIGVRDLLP